VGSNRKGIPRRYRSNPPMELGSPPRRQKIWQIGGVTEQLSREHTLGYEFRRISGRGRWDSFQKGGACRGQGLEGVHSRCHFLQPVVGRKRSDPERNETKIRILSIRVGKQRRETRNRTALDPWIWGEKSRFHRNLEIRRKKRAESASPTT